MASAPAELITALQAAPAGSLELRLRELRARLEMGELAAAARALAALEADHPDDWRVVWYRGVAALADRRARDRGAVLRRDLRRVPRRARAQAGPRRVRGGARAAGQRRRVLPPGVDDRPQLCELGVRPGPRAARLGRPPWRRTAHWNPYRSRRSTTRRRGSRPCGRGCGSGLAEEAPAAPFLDDLTAAAGQVEALDGYGLDAVRREQLSTEVLGCALDWVLSGSQVFRSGLRRRTCAARQRAGRARPPLRSGALVPDAGPARAGRRGEDRSGGTCQPLPPPDVGVIDVPDAPADGPFAVPQLRGATGGG